ncbi:endonuclease Ecym_3061 [Eremothecium cymbalariae DBVPG|uniref:GIY-YIG domain-containing protein n=1 Tax=Eremothecium cymbalariae (strain CBS 270.75 / DBVPG 7215 / KCTC 17166 / NRRL Y-17582) TaxID=931890 RepID=G8JR04_ERECY|nr:Hypothetical protein Ecym_3061 [Eremothecium cymbalariae DBVPG\
MTDNPNLHVFPEFYCSYLLRSIPKRLSYYIGSTPNPVRRLRQHNGLLTKGGAYRTKREGTRPWELVVFVYGFPSKIAALQFEHAWQHSYKTRFIAADKRVVKNKTSGRSIHQKIAVVKLLLSHPFFAVMNLTVQIFSEEIHNIWMQDKFKVGTAAVNFQVTQNASTELYEDNDEDIVEYAMQNLKLIEVFYEEVIQKYKKYLDRYQERLTYGQLPCNICGKKLNAIEDDHKTLVCFCISDVCNFISCLECLYYLFVSGEEVETGNKPIIPTKGQCPTCSVEMSWSNIVKYSTKIYEKT